MPTGTKALTSPQLSCQPRLSTEAHQGAGPTRTPSVLSSTRSLTNASTNTKPKATITSSQIRIAPVAKAGSGNTSARYSSTKVLRISGAIG